MPRWRGKVAPFGLLISTGTFPSLSLSLSRTASSGPSTCVPPSLTTQLVAPHPSSQPHLPSAGQPFTPPLQASRSHPRAKRPGLSHPPNLQSASGPPISYCKRIQVHTYCTDTGQAKPTGCISSCTRTCKYYYFDRYVQVQVQVHVHVHVHVHPCRAISYFSWPPRAQKCNYSCICIPASPNFPALLFVLSAANPRPHLLDPLSICFSLCALFSIC